MNLQATKEYVTHYNCNRAIFSGPTAPCISYKEQELVPCATEVEGTRIGEPLTYYTIPLLDHSH